MPELIILILNFFKGFLGEIGKIKVETVRFPMYLLMNSGTRLVQTWYKNLVFKQVFEFLKSVSF